ncbi:uncharacterized protein LOC121244183 [Juglans microcarpa x Juglans regia]|uniref:uncharacterized protein LOC121244183 n=1 Tax=Juglans microcarpa x Juglans regia TaxID=2249226 RepID=UPI001B7F0B81|nr:uncharacterized protein LOC121244183 [Juglans microcarpa x Juglans regia]
MTRKTLSTRIEEFEGKHVGLTRNANECCMYKVHEQLRNVNEKAYKPVLLAIGPYNDQSKVGQGFMEDHKLRYLYQMLKRKGGSVEAYTTTLTELEEPARKCYVECISQTPEEFVEMMVLDGCFIIELFHKHEIYKETGDFQDDPIFKMKWVLPRIARDLLLFENQLPFFVLEKLFMMSERKDTLNRSKHLGEHTGDIDEEENGISVESSTSTTQIIQTRLYDLALNFFYGYLHFQWNIVTSGYNSTEKIKHLLCLVHEDLTSSLLHMICLRLTVGFRFKKAEFEHLLGLIHASIGISLLDTEIEYARERQEVGVKLKNAKIFKSLFGPIREAIIPLLAKMENMRKAISYTSQFQKPRFQVNMAEIENWESIPFGLEFQEVGIEFKMAKKFKDDGYKIIRWTSILHYNELQKAGIDFDKAKKFQDLHNRNRNEDQNSKPCVIVEKFTRLLCQIKIETWKSIPYGKELREAGVEFNKAKKFKRSLLALREIEARNIHGATELAEAGIEFKKAEKSNVFSIKFNNGLMEISPLTIQDHTETYLRNLIAYEQYYHRHTDVNYVYNYVCFLDDLINTPKDVELLRRRGIIHNNLGDDEVISAMVNKLGHNVSFTTNIYERTIMNVNLHCRRRRNVWMAKLRRDYFNSPWAWISFLAAFLLLALTATQTIFSIIH